MEKYRFGDIVSLNGNFVEYNIDTYTFDILPVKMVESLYISFGFAKYSGYRLDYLHYKEGECTVDITLNSHGTITCYNKGRLVLRTNGCKYLHDFQKLVEYINSTKNNILSKLEQNINNLVK